MSKINSIFPPIVALLVFLFSYNTAAFKTGTSSFRKSDLTQGNIISSSSTLFAQESTAYSIAPPLPGKKEKENKQDERSSIRSLQSRQDFFNFIDSDAPLDSLTVVKYYSKNCQLCKRIDLRYKKMALYYQTANMQFAEMLKPADPELFDAFIQTFPTFGIYRNCVCVAMLAVTDVKTMEPKLHSTIQHELTMTPADWDKFLNAFAEPIAQSTAKLDRFRSTLL
mmetsp:Transcript_20892/g.26990  ORF Transcript_20892/g.26990 Transcript_20892/m.26990 type:complete len:224 (+) Transcript_20892:119-790(+)|eukprot:CAMPEP_0198138382 /NCGR_PEP_ID=MMETSP1443-20131203/1798_1 /TAXON_ID=186043 /ORGANISM="Entomoneis sp., Strain CCMP2396" /LENGTH=223 /DNA_ID=CAMNT_0043800137 /DNA_START=161 /DNA_END=832 /DNA_ORIENTATION=+